MSKVVKADPGYEILRAYEGKDHVVVERFSVVAWRITKDADAVPVAIGVGNSNINALKHPDGRVHCETLDTDDIFDNEAAWVEDWKRQRANQLQAEEERGRRRRAHIVHQERIENLGRIMVALIDRHDHYLEINKLINLDRPAQDMVSALRGLSHEEAGRLVGREDDWL
jgi:hypothetical protein